MTEQAASPTGASHLQDDCGLRLNGCPCGFQTHPRKECTCSLTAVSRYQKRIRGPLFDRIGVFVEVPPVEYEKLVANEPDEASERVRDRVEQARDVVIASVM